MFPCSRFLNSSSFVSRSVAGKYLSKNNVLNPCHVIPSRFTVSFLSCHHWSTSLSSWWDASRIRSSSFVISIVFRIFSVFRNQSSAARGSIRRSNSGGLYLMNSFTKAMFLLPPNGVPSHRWGLLPPWAQVHLLRLDVLG